MCYIHHIKTFDLLCNYESILNECDNYILYNVGKLTNNAALDAPGLVAIAVCHGFALFVAVSIAANHSGGHVNPAVTFGLVLGGKLKIVTGVCYWVAQLLGSTAACFLLKFVTGGLVCSITIQYRTFMKTCFSIIFINVLKKMSRR